MNGVECGRRLSLPNLRQYSGIFVEGLRKTTKNFSHDSRSPGRDLNPGPLEYKAEVLTTRPRRSICEYQEYLENAVVMKGSLNKRDKSASWSSSCYEG
jgi:hypothetical protein